MSKNISIKFPLHKYIVYKSKNVLLTETSYYSRLYGTCIFSTDSNQADTNKESFNKETFENGKVKGFRNWTQPMEQDLLETGGKVLNNDPSLEKGSSAFNRVLLKVNTILK